MSKTKRVDKALQFTRKQIAEDRGEIKAKTMPPASGEVVLEGEAAKRRAEELTRWRDPEDVIFDKPREVR